MVVALALVERSIVVKVILSEEITMVKSSEIGKLRFPCFNCHVACYVEGRAIRFVMAKVERRDLPATLFLSFNKFV